MTGGELTLDEIRALVDPIPGDYVVYRLSGRKMTVLHFTDTILDSFGITDADFRAATADDAMNVVVAGDRERVLESVMGKPVGPELIECVFRLLHRDNGFFWVHSKSRIIGTFEGDPVILTNYLDSSAEAEAYSSILDNSGTAIYLVDTGSCELLYANRATQKRAMVEDGRNYVGVPCYKYLFLRDEPCPNCDINRLTPGQTLREELYDEKTGRWRASTHRLVNWRGRDCLEVSTEDITEKKARDARDRADRRRYELAIKGAKLAVWEYDVPGRRMILPEGDEGSYAAQRYGLSGNVAENIPDAMLPMAMTDEDAQNFINMFLNIWRGEEYVTGEFWFRAPGSADPRCERVTYYVEKNAQGEPLVAYGVGQDITVERLERERFQNTIQQLITTNSRALCVFRLNLTQNTCGEEHGTSRYIQKLLMADTVDELFGKIAAIIPDALQRQKFRALFNREELLAVFGREENRVSLDYRRLMEDGEAHWVRTQLTMLKNPGTGDVEAIIYSEDIDEDVREEAIIRCIVQEEFDSLAIIDVRKGTIRFRTMRKEAVSTTPHMLPIYDDDILYAFKKVDPENWQQDIEAINLRRIVSELESTPIYTYAFTMRDDEGRVYRKMLKYCYVDESRQEILLSRNDITAEYEQSKRQLGETRAALLEADRANAMKSRFLSNVSHDMRTPLNAVLGYDRLALNTADPDKKDDYLRKIGQAGGNLLSLINDTLDLQKIETGVTTLKPAPISCGDLIKGIVNAVKPMMDEKNIDFEVDNSRAVMAVINVDAMRVEEIFINLLSNAAKFTPEGGRVELIVECEKLEKYSVHDRVIIRDNGVGISPEFLPKIFEPFAQERTASTANIGGTGLGLSIVEGLVKMMGDTIEVESSPGQGTQFTLHLSFQRVDDMPGVMKSDGRYTPGELSGMRVLLCEDNAMNTEIAKILLEMHGIEVVCAANGREGAEKFINSQPGEFGAVLMDLRMPVMDGYEAASLIRASRRDDAAAVPIIAMSADAYEEDVEKCRQAGMNSHISKPIDPADLLGTLAELRRGEGRD